MATSMRALVDVKRLVVPVSLIHQDRVGEERAGDRKSAVARVEAIENVC